MSASRDFITTQQRHRPLAALCLSLACLLSTHAALANEGRYRVEVIVFQNTTADAVPAEVETVRPFHDLFELDDDAVPEAPVF